MPNRPSSLHMQILGKQFASGFTGKLNFLATAAHQWKAAFWFKQGRMINFCYHQQWAAAALFNFCYDFAPVLTALAEEGQHPLAPLTWVAEPEIFSRGEAWSWSWQDFCQAWQQQAQMAMQYRRKAPRPQYQLRVALGLTTRELSKNLTWQERDILQAIIQYPCVRDLYDKTSWAAGDLTRTLVQLKQAGLIKAVQAHDDGPIAQRTLSFNHLAQEASQN